jgi:nitrate reductase assembly molybdenum cofactor insertion protein NarJ
MLWLDTSKQALQDVKEQASRSIREKDDIIAQLTQRIESMESSYESVLNVSTQHTYESPSLDKGCRRRWMLWPAGSNKLGISGR